MAQSNVGGTYLDAGRGLVRRRVATPEEGIQVRDAMGPKGRRIRILVFSGAPLGLKKRARSLNKVV